MRTIVWDVDDVLNELTAAWMRESWLPAHPACELRVEDLVVNPPHSLLGVSQEEYLASLDAFRLSARGMALEPVADVIRWFHEHGEKFRHVALTATPRSYAQYSSAWVLEHFGDWIRSFNFVPSARSDRSVPLYDEDKAGFLGWWGKADVIVEDNAVHVEAARSAGMLAILVPQPWNGGQGTVAEALGQISA